MDSVPRYSRIYNAVDRLARKCLRWQPEYFRTSLIPSGGPGNRIIWIVSGFISSKLQSYMPKTIHWQLGLLDLPKAWGMRSRLRYI
jgi:hypothetical protein